jgi:hypothetical protein
MWVVVSAESDDCTDARTRTQSAGQAVLLTTIVVLIIVTLEQLLETSGWHGDQSSDRHHPFYGHSDNQTDSLKCTARASVLWFRIPFLHASAGTIRPQFLPSLYPPYTQKYHVLALRQYPTIYSHFVLPTLLSYPAVLQFSVRRGPCVLFQCIAVNTSVIACHI